MNRLLEEYLRRHEERTEARARAIEAGADYGTMDDRDPDEQLLIQAITEIQREATKQSQPARHRNRFLSRRGADAAPLIISLRRVSFAPVFGIFVTKARGRGNVVFDKIGKYKRLRKEIVVDEARALYWLGKGAEPTKPVRALLRRVGIMEKSQLGEASAKSMSEVGRTKM